MPATGELINGPLDGEVFPMELPHNHVMTFREHSFARYRHDAGKRVWVFIGWLASAVAKHA